MKRAFIIHGPSGVGKSTLAQRICSAYAYVHCDADAFKLLFSEKRSRERSLIGERTCNFFTREVITSGRNMVIEALPDAYLRTLIPLLRKKRYEIIEISLTATVEQCIKNDATRTKRKYGSAVIQEVHPKYTFNRGDVIDVAGKSATDVFLLIKKKYF